jgi:hypothetical protein
MDALEHPLSGEVVEITSYGHVRGTGGSHQLADRDPAGALQSLDDDPLPL